MIVHIHQISNAQSCINSGTGVWGSIANVGILTNVPVKPLHILGQVQCPDPAIRLEYQPYWGHLVLQTPGNPGYSIVGTPGDLILHSDVNSGDILLTTRNNASSIRFATTPIAQGTDFERMTIRESGQIGIWNTQPDELLHIGSKMTFHVGANRDFIGYNDKNTANDIRRYITWGSVPPPPDPPVTGYASCLEFRNEWKQTGLRIAAPDEPDDPIDYTEPLQQGENYSGEKGLWLGLSENQNYATVGIGAGAPLDSRLFIRSMSANSSLYYTLKLENKAGNTLFVVRDDGNVGINNPTPTYKLDVIGRARISDLPIVSNPIYNITLDEYGALTKSYVPVQSTDYWNINGNSSISANDYIGTRNGEMDDFVIGTFGESRIRVSWEGQVQIGGEEPTGANDDYLLSVFGKIVSTEIVVIPDDDIEWSDFVFNEEYKLTDLFDLEKLIKIDKHLPGMPTVDNIKQKGINLGEMDAKLLQKIEELTLYIIEINKKNNTLVQEIELLKSKFQNNQ